MKTTRGLPKASTALCAATALALFSAATACGITTAFFDASQMTNLVEAGTTWDTLSSEGYLFTVTRDKLFTGGIGMTNPIGRYLRVSWPAGLEAQAVTAGPVLSKARIDVSREDGQPFAIQSFTAQLLANTYGAGGAIEVMPLIGGEDAALEPFMYNATGFAGAHFTYATPELAAFDAYKITLYVDYALMRLTVVDASLGPPSVDIVSSGGAALEIRWPTNAFGYSLEAATNLAGIWTSVTNAIVISGDQFTVQVPTDAPGRFYRLRK